MISGVIDNNYPFIKKHGMAVRWYKAILRFVRIWQMTPKINPCYQRIGGSGSLCIANFASKINTGRFLTKWTPTHSNDDVTFAIVMVM